MTKNLTSFSEDKQPVKRRGKAQRTLLLDALKEQSYDEGSFYKLILERAMNPNDPASAMLMKEVLTRLYPNAKPTMPLVEFELPSNSTPVKKVEALEKAVSDGSIPGDLAKVMVDIIKSGLEIGEITDLKDRIEALEAALNGGAAKETS